MKKKLVGGLFTGIMVMGMSFSCLASSSTDSFSSPNLTTGVTMQTPVYNLETSDTSVISKNVSATFGTFGTLSNSFQSKSSRKLRICVFEFDQAPNAHDKAKAYNGKFSGRALKDVVRDETENNELANNVLDSKGDKQGEMFLKINLARATTDTTQAVPRALFSYRIFLK